MDDTRNDDTLEYDQLIQLLSIYESEWEHRNSFIWTHIFKFFYLSIFVMVLPNITDYLSISLPSIPYQLFPVSGIVISTISLYFSVSYSKRLEASSMTYDKINKLLPESYRKTNLIEMKNGKYFMIRHTLIIPVIMYSILLFIGAILINTHY